MIKFLKDKWIFLVFVLVVFGILSISGNFKQSTSSAKYRSEVSGTDSGRIAKWDIKTISKKDGAEISLDTGFGTTLSTGSTGNWFIEISNSSEVNAALSNDTTFRFRIDHTTFDGTEETINWNFLKDSELEVITNPVTIKITIYKSTIDSLNIAYQTTTIVDDNPVVTTITKAQYDAKSDEEKKAYAEVVTNSGYEVFTTTAQSFNLDSEEVHGNLVYYYYKDIKVSEIAGLTDAIKKLTMNDTNSNITIGINWATGQDKGGGTGVSDTKVYKTFEIFDANDLPNDFTAKYEEIGRKTYGKCLGHEGEHTHIECPQCGLCVDANCNGQDSEKCLGHEEHVHTICAECGLCMDKNCDGPDEAKTYVFAYRDCYFFDYQIFTSSFGGNGEPYFKFIGDYQGSELIKYYSEIIETEDENTIKAYLSFTDTDANGTISETEIMNQITAAVTDAPNYKRLQQILDFCRYNVHGEFIHDNDLYQESLSYLQYGLTCSVQMTIKVEQLD
ncbi:MAG: hypothetical protein IJE45_06245 [Bacilli bacterium]|nr:hypothetical protein [Bacilli bacterium]